MCTVIDLLRTLIEEQRVLIKIEFQPRHNYVWTIVHFNWISAH